MIIIWKIVFEVTSLNSTIVKKMYSTFPYLKKTHIHYVDFQICDFIDSK